MRQQGSILVVVLGLLAILAVIGVAFLTLSSLERSTAASFALQTQMMLAADGAIEYAIHQMVLDVWEWDVDAAQKFSFTNKLLTGRAASGVPPTVPYGGACEPYDYPSAADDPWLSTSIVSNAKPTWISFATTEMGTVEAANRFRIRFGTRPAESTWPDNLGLPVASPAPNGIWIPDLAAPCDQYLVRASLTILDHGALVNLNAHGSKNTGAWEYGDCIGKGYFISDVVPPVTDLNALLFGTGAVPGCWGSDGPGNPKAGAVLIENPAAGNDVPYTLDEEFELRNLWGTYFKSRLEWIWPALLSDPATATNVSAYARRLKTTTVSWTAEVRGDGNAASHATMKDAAGADLGWSAAKADLNTASPDDIYNALLDGRVMADGNELKQLVANIVSFRRKQTDRFEPVNIGGSPYIGAARQPIITEATALLEAKVSGEDPSQTERRYLIKLEVYNPWPGDYPGDPDNRLDTTGLRIEFEPGPDVALTSGRYLDLGALSMAQGETIVIENKARCVRNTRLCDDTALRSIKLFKSVSGKNLVLDLLAGRGADTDIGRLMPQADTEGASNRLHRPVHLDSEKRGTPNFPIPILYVGNWVVGGEPPDLGTVPDEGKGTKIPIRFLHSVPPNYVGGLPVRPTDAPGEAFKAFTRTGDLNQVLRFQPGTSEWWSEPWIVPVSKTSSTNESNVKFDWMKDIGNVAAGTGTAAAYAANVLSVGGPWNDGIDNDGDGETDFADTGKPGAGQPGGPECRVAGLINLNTATDDTLQALLSGTGASTGAAAQIKAARPLKSPAQILTGATLTAQGLEQRDLPFTLISNIATVRSDTFSVYGTVQIVNPSRAQNAGNRTIDQPEDIIRTRRFWALVDRSPALAYPPTDTTNFIRPRILNFQWLD